MSGDPWFVRRQLGLGWRPATWQGWMITAIAVAVVVVTLVLFRIHKSPIGIVVVVAILGVYAAIAAMMSRRPALAAAGQSDSTAPEPHLPQSGAAAAAPERALAPVAPQQARPVIDRPAQRRGTLALEVAHLTKRFGDRIAFQDVSFTVGAGEVFGFLGPNGAGKTTTVRTLGTLIAPTAGSAIVAGFPLLPGNSQAIRQRIAIMPEAPGLYLRLSVRENLEYFAGLFSVENPRARIGEALEAVNMQSRSEDPCGSLSKGLRQRVGVARALLSDPDILFLDEPTSGLDPVATRDVNDLIEGLRRRGATVFLTTHRLEEAERLCDRVAILNTTLRMVGRPDELRAQLFSRSLVVRTAAPLPAADAVFGSVSGIQSWHADSASGYVLTVSDPKTVAPALTRALVAADADVESIAEVQHSLEDVYLELINEDVEARGR
ncbi:MAG TPA: ABC transporter ATP-binding protein [Candidatus Dormibacteraeota bacterium]